MRGHRRKTNEASTQTRQTRRSRVNGHALTSDMNFTSGTSFDLFLTANAVPPHQRMGASPAVRCRGLVGGTQGFLLTYIGYGSAALPFCIVQWTCSSMAWGC